MSGGKAFWTGAASVLVVVFFWSGGLLVTSSSASGSGVPSWRPLQPSTLVRRWWPPLLFAMVGQEKMSDVQRLIRLVAALIMMFTSSYKLCKEAKGGNAYLLPGMCALFRQFGAWKTRLFIRLPLLLCEVSGFGATGSSPLAGHDASDPM